MQQHLQLSDQEFLTQFEQCTLQPEWFTHEAHLRLAFLLIQQYGAEKGALHLCRQISKFDQIYGDGTKFNTTITFASAKAMHHFMSKAKSSEFTELLEEFPRLRTHFRELLESHYSHGVLRSEKAKKAYIEPDLLAF